MPELSGKNVYKQILHTHYCGHFIYDNIYCGMILHMIKKHDESTLFNHDTYKTNTF